VKDKEREREREREREKEREETREMMRPATYSACGERVGGVELSKKAWGSSSQSRPQ